MGASDANKHISVCYFFFSQPKILDYNVYNVDLNINSIHVINIASPPVAVIE